MDRRRAQVRRHYLRLGTGELVAAAVFVVVALVMVMPRLDGWRSVVALWSALLPLVLILGQGGCYWLLARTWVVVSSMPPVVARIFGALRIADVALLGAGLAGLVVWWPEDLAARVLVVGIWLFGVVEYVNYYVVRLSYPVASWAGEVGRWRRSRLARDLHRAGRARPRISKV